MLLQTEVTDEEIAIIGHVVVDPIAWLQNAYDQVGPRAIMEKIAKYKPEYDAAKAAQGVNYKNRAQRDAVTMATIINASK
jgi:hypothetical protein